MDIVHKKTFNNIVTETTGVKHAYYVKPEDWTVEQMDEFNLSITTTFRRDMENAGYNAETYHGRYMYKGIGVTIDDDDYLNVIRATNLDLNSDRCGKRGVIVYPVMMTWPEPGAYVSAELVAKELSKI